MRKRKETDIKSDLIIGRNPVLEALKAGREIDTIFVVKGERQQGSIGKIIALSRDAGVIVKDTNQKKLDFMCGGANHQGIIARVAAHSYASIDDIFSLAKTKSENPFIIICDEIEDPHNLGAIIRTAECAGAHGVIIPKRRSATLNFTVAKTAAGALEYMPVARVSNLSVTIDKLKERGVWIYGTDMQGDAWCKTDLSGPLALIVGSEGKGMGRLVREKCDFILSLPIRGEINSLNASVAAGIVMYEVSRQRLQIKTI
ncbi:MAG: 23S rRNA (guanosine(2251)-2'-O)-methyltransferase RlmB [Ruminococcaceae bacterium]|nr:23S rRNA (guanosine(2251)-2'-O)-methyltransferase RlmB [Oscillospiraceae bacterium]